MIKIQKFCIQRIARGIVQLPALNRLKSTASNQLPSPKNVFPISKNTIVIPSNYQYTNPSKSQMSNKFKKRIEQHGTSLMLKHSPSKDIQQLFASYGFDIDYKMLNDNTCQITFSDSKTAFRALKNLHVSRIGEKGLDLHIINRTSLLCDDLDPAVKESDLQNIFSKHSYSCRVHKNTENTQIIGLVSFYTKQDAMAALKLNGQLLHSRPLSLSISHPYKLIITNVPLDISLDAVKSVLPGFPLSIKIAKTYLLVSYSSRKHAQHCIDVLHGTKIQGAVVKAKWQNLPVILVKMGVGSRSSNSESVVGYTNSKSSLEDVEVGGKGNLNSKLEETYQEQDVDSTNGPSSPVQPQEITVDDIKSSLSQYGTIKSIRLLRTPSGQSRHIALVVFSKYEHVLASLAHQSIGSSAISITYGEPTVHVWNLPDVSESQLLEVFRGYGGVEASVVESKGRRVGIEDDDVEGGEARNGEKSIIEATEIKRSGMDEGEKSSIRRSGFVVFGTWDEAVDAAIAINRTFIDETLVFAKIQERSQVSK